MISTAAAFRTKRQNIDCMVTFVDFFTYYFLLGRKRILFIVRRSETYLMHCSKIVAPKEYVRGQLSRNPGSRGCHDASLKLDLILRNGQRRGVPSSRSAPPRS